MPKCCSLLFCSTSETRWNEDLVCIEKNVLTFFGKTSFTLAVVVVLVDVVIVVVVVVVKTINVN